MRALILLRIVAELLAAVAGGVGALIYVGIGQTDHAITHVLVCGVVVWLVRPNNEQRAMIAQFQASREKYPTK